MSEEDKVAAWLLRHNRMIEALRIAISDVIGCSVTVGEASTVWEIWRDRCDQQGLREK